MTPRYGVYNYPWIPCQQCLGPVLSPARLCADCLAETRRSRVHVICGACGQDHGDGVASLVACRRGNR